MGRYDDIPMLFHTIFPISYSNIILFNVTGMMVNDIGTISSAIDVPSIVKAILSNGISIPLNVVSASSVSIYATFHGFARHFSAKDEKDIPMDDGTGSTDVEEGVLEKK